MAEKPKRERVNARLATLAVLEILKEESSKEHPLKIGDILRFLKRDYDIAPTRETVGTILTELRDFYGDKVICCQETEKHSGHDYTYNYYYQKTFSNEEVEMLINDVMFSRMRTDGQVKRLTKKLRGLADGQFAHENLNYLSQIPAKQYTANEQVQKNIGLVRRVIVQNMDGGDTETLLDFRFNGYGADKALHETREFYNLLPVRVCLAWGSYYLICLPRDTDRPFHFRLDLITDLRETVQEKIRDPEREKKIQWLLSEDISEYLASHLYMYYEKDGETPKTVHLQVKKLKDKPDASLTVIRDAFGGNWNVVRGTDYDETVDIKVKCLPSAVSVFVREHMDRVRVVGPEDVKEAIENDLRIIFEEYFRKV